MRERGQTSVYPYVDSDTCEQEDVLNASALHFGYCAGDVVRFQILQGRLWVDFRTEREATGWYPMKNGPGVLTLRTPCRKYFL